LTQYHLLKETKNRGKSADVYGISCTVRQLFKGTGIMGTGMQGQSVQGTEVKDTRVQGKDLTLKLVC
jgi:hypothetical protein